MTCERNCNKMIISLQTRLLRGNDDVIYSLLKTLLMEQRLNVVIQLSNYHGSQQHHAEVSRQVIVVKMCINCLNMGLL